MATRDPVNDDVAELIRRECRAARRLTRLFRIEHGKGFARRAPGTGQWLVERRGDVIDEVLRLERARQSQATETSAELDAALIELAGEVKRSQPLAQERVALLVEELGRRRSGNPASGIRAGITGQLLGRG